MTRLPIGLAVTRPSPRAAVEAIVRMEAAGLTGIWSTVVGAGPDNVTTLAVAAAQTERIGIGTSVIPAYPRHPLITAAQALVFADLAPQRLRLGVGPSHRPTIEGMFGIPMGQPLVYMREYLTVLRRYLWDGSVDFEGDYFRVHAALPPNVEPPRTPLLLSALRPNAFKQAGEIADGAISWVCPIPYLVEIAMPAMQAGAEEAERPVPPLVAHVPVALTEDLEAAREAGREFLGRYARLPFYAGMFARAGHPVGDDATVSEGLIDTLLVSGTSSEVVSRLEGILHNGVQEVLVTLLPVDDPGDLEMRFAQSLPR